MAESSGFMDGMSRKRITVIAGICVASVVLIAVIVAVAVYSSKGSERKVGEIRSKKNEKCDSGRYYIGDVNNAFPQYQASTGIFVETSDRPNPYPHYKHESRELFLEYKWNRGWVVKSVFSYREGMMVITKAHRPDRAKEQWCVRYGKDHDRAFQKNLRAVCVDKSFVTCHSGQVRVSGLEKPISDSLRSFMGTYSLMNRLFNDRQVYRQIDGKGYLFYRSYDEMWGINNESPFISPAMWIYVDSNAIRPEYIMSKLWTAFDYNVGHGDTWQHVTIKCVNRGKPAVRRVEPNLKIHPNRHLPYYYLGVRHCTSPKTNHTTWCSIVTDYSCCTNIA